MGSFVFLCVCEVLTLGLTVYKIQSYSGVLLCSYAVDDVLHIHLKPLTSRKITLAVY